MKLHEYYISAQPTPSTPFPALGIALPRSGRTPGSAATTARLSSTATLGRRLVQAMRQLCAVCQWPVFLWRANTCRQDWHLTGPVPSSPSAGPRGSRLYIVMQLLSGGEVTPAIQKRRVAHAPRPPSPRLRPSSACVAHHALCRRCVCPAPSARPLRLPPQPSLPDSRFIPSHSIAQVAR